MIIKDFIFDVFAYAKIILRITEKSPKVKRTLNLVISESFYAIGRLHGIEIIIVIDSEIIVTLLREIGILASGHLPIADVRILPRRKKSDKTSLHREDIVELLIAYQIDIMIEHADIVTALECSIHQSSHLVIRLHIPSLLHPHHGVVCKCVIHNACVAPFVVPIV